MSEERQRVDQWLWHARFFKTRTLAANLCAGGRVRINRVVVSKPHTAVKPGDVLTFPQGPHIRVVRVVALAARRGPASEAQALYQDLTPPTAEKPGAAAPRERGAGRPTKAERRAITRLKGEE